MSILWRDRALCAEAAERAADYVRLKNAVAEGVNIGMGGGKQ